ncbi:hypothetical protein [Loktanella sp. 3ANDIMAR09]|uniref:hypothetical protein n=1 Tax=Loktanella sp. 3ANDIMAR09 TaxID=1225657 RepID=UPI000A90A973|nr:hypothetical protein [Loktanella sp. 3ANDIMAR09]
MTDASTTNPVPANVAQIAVAEEKLDMTKLALIGLRLSQNGNAALIRTARGAISQVTIGDRVDNMTVVAVSEHGLSLLDRRGVTRRLTMPG